MKKRVARSSVNGIENHGDLATRMESMRKVASEFGAFRPASEVLTTVRSVPTIFPQFDHATRVGGLPIERFTLVHGSSAGGKSFYCIGLMLSFLMRDHPVFFIDAERTTPYEWMRNVMGPYLEHPYFKAWEPKSYEATVEEVRAFLKKVRALRDKGKLAPDASGLVVVDSIRKLVPRDQMKRILAESKRADGEENVRNRGAQIKAQMNAAWLDELVLLLDETKTAMVAVAREMVDADAPARRFGPKQQQGPVVKTAGGAALFYDASLDLRVSRVKTYGREVEGKFRAFGDVHKIEIQKSKVSGKEQHRAECLFHISNGAWVPSGFDRARDLVELARRFDVVEGTNALRFGDAKWRNEDLAVKRLTEDQVLFARVEAECRKLFKGAEAR